jgi:hypothetical protein
MARCGKCKRSFEPDADHAMGVLESALRETGRPMHVDANAKWNAEDNIHIRFGWLRAAVAMAIAEHRYCLPCSFDARDALLKSSTEPRVRILTDEFTTK